MTGGGARAAYQVGVLRAVVKRWPDFHPPIITGVSAGAINAIALAVRQGTFAEAVGLLTRMWMNLTSEQVFRTDVGTLVSIASRWVSRLSSGGRAGRGARALLSTGPLRQLISRAVADAGGLDNLERNIFAGRLNALGITATNYGTGRSVTWVQGRHVRSWEYSERHSVRTSIGIDHIMASAALPIVFPAVRIGGAWHGDGGIRQIAPLSPTLRLGASRILAVNTRYVRTAEEAERPAIADYPPPAQIVGVLMNAVFLDSMDQDAQTLTRISSLAKQLPEAQREGLRPVEILTLRPSQDVARIAAEYEIDLPPAFRFAMRGLGSRETESPDWLSMLLFEPAYIRRVMDLGESDAEERLGELAAILDLPHRQEF
jgi:NTE family protein